MNSQTWLTSNIDKPIKLPINRSLNSIQIINEGKQLLFAIHNDCYIGSIRNYWSCQKLFHDSTKPVTVVKVVPSSNPLRILCVYTDFPVLFEIRNETTLFSTRILKNYNASNYSIFKMDTHKNFFILCNTENCVSVFDYEKRDPIKIISYNEIEQHCGIETPTFDNRTICKIAVDVFNHQKVFACLAHDFCCVYNVACLTKPIAFLTPAIVQKKRNDSTCQPFLSFTFCQNDSILILTETEIIEWNYSSHRVSSLFNLDRSARSLHLSVDGSLLEVVRSTEIVLYSFNLYDTVSRRSSKADQKYLKKLKLPKYFEFDSFFDRTTKRYLLIVRYPKNNGLFLYSNQPLPAVKSAKQFQLTPSIRHRQSQFSPSMNEPLHETSTMSKSDYPIDLVSDFEEITQRLAVQDTNSSITLISSNTRTGVLVVGYTLLNALIKVTLSFGKSKPASDFMYHLPDTGNDFQPSYFSYDNLIIHAELEEPNARVMDMIGFIRLRLNFLAANFRTEISTTDRSLNRASPVYDILKKILKIVDEVNQVYPAEKPVNHLQAPVSAQVENDDSLIEPPCLSFMVFCNDVMIRVTNSKYVGGIDMGSNPPSSYLDYKNMERRRSHKFDSDTLFNSSDSDSTSEEYPHTHIHTNSNILLDYHQAHFLSTLVTHLHIPSLVAPSLDSLTQCIEANLHELMKLNDTQESLGVEEIRKRIPIWRIMKTLFSHRTSGQSFGALSFFRHTLNQLWNMAVEQGDLLILSEIITFCRLYSRINHDDVFQQIQKCKKMDMDNVLIMMAAVLDRKQLYDRKMEFLKYVLNSTKLQMPLIPTTESTMNTPIETAITRSRHKNDELEDSLRRSGMASSVVDDMTPNTPRTMEMSYLHCAVCKKQINGLFIICQFCNHVFHVDHYIQWFEEKEECPIRGCRHYCNHSLSTEKVL